MPGKFISVSSHKFHMINIYQVLAGLTIIKDSYIGFIYRSIYWKSAAVGKNNFETSSRQGKGELKAVSGE